MASPQDKIREKVAGELRPSEQVEAAFGAQTASNYWLLAVGVGFFAVNEFRSVVVTAILIAAVIKRGGTEQQCR